MHTFEPLLRVPSSHRQACLWAAILLVACTLPSCDSSGPGGDPASNKAPEARFTVSEASPRAGEQVTLNASGSADPDGDIANYLWDFGADGGAEKTGPQVTWRFDAADTTDVRLTVTGSQGVEASTESEALVQPGVEAAFTYTPEAPRAGEEVTFDASASNEPLGEIERYAWDFNGDGRVDATGKTATHVFSYVRGDSAGVALTVTGEESVTGAAQKALALRPLKIVLQARSARITQSVQRYESGEPRVPLVAGRDGFLRVFLQAGQDNPYRPEVQVQFFDGGGSLVETLTATAGQTIPTDPRAGDLSDTWNVAIPGELIQPGLSVRVQANPDGAIPLAEESQARFPAGSEPLALDVREVPTHRATFVPIRRSNQGTVGKVNESNVEEYLEDPRDLFPIAEYDANIHSTYTTDLRINGASGALLDEIKALRTAEGSGRYYYGVYRREESDDGAYGKGYYGKSAIGIDVKSGGASNTYAHELGHNFHRPHVPCGDPNDPDPDYPYRGGRIGAYGFDLDAGELRSPNEWKDLMSYCYPKWISDYTYTAILNYRGFSSGTGASGRSVAGSDREEPVLLVWGRVAGDEATLEPAFEIDAAPKLPSGSGPYTLEGFDAQGTQLFSFSFAGTKVADGPPGARSFAFAIPRSRTGGDRLARLEVSGPQGASATLRSQGQAQGQAQPLSRSAGTFSLRRAGRGTARLQWSAPSYRAVMVRDARTGEVLTIARGGEARLHAGPADKVRLLFSDGVRTTEKSARVR